MALSKLDSLYMAVVSDHSKHPHHRGKLPNLEVLEMHNPTCGDVIELTIAIDQTDRIADMAFDGAGCSISTASASMMTDALIGKSLIEAQELAQLFSQMVQGQEQGDVEKLGEAGLLAGVAKFPQRIKCATLPWNALKRAIERHRERE